MKFTDILVEAQQEQQNLQQLADEIEAAGPQVLEFFLKELRPVPTQH